MFFLEFCAAFGVTLAETAPYLILGFVVAGVLREFIPADALRRRVGGRGVAPVLRAVGVGALLPVCSCSTIPIGIGLRRSGAATGTALAFMTSGPAVSPVTLLLGWSMLGPWLLGWYVAWALGGALAIGWLGNRLLSGATPLEPKPAACGCGCGSKSTERPSRLVKAVRWALLDLGTEVSTSLFLGLAVASVVLVALPSEAVSQWLSQPSWLALLAAIAIALPAYTCSVPSLVIAGSLLAKGVDPGVAVAFLVAGPATNLGELNAIRTALGSRAALFYSGSLVAIALVAGGLTSSTPLTAAAVTGSPTGHQHTHAIDAAFLSDAIAPSLAEVALWKWPFVAAVVGLAASGMARSAYSQVATHGRPDVRRPKPAVALPGDS